MALKHLRDAVELMRGGMSIADITRIVGLQEDSAQDQEEQPEAESQETASAPAEAPEEKPAPQPAPTNRPEHNNEPSTLVDELNKLF